jgi:hypothetical protein
VLAYFEQGWGGPGARGGYIERLILGVVPALYVKLNSRRTQLASRRSRQLEARLYITQLVGSGMADGPQDEQMNGNGLHGIGES